MRTREYLGVVLALSALGLWGGCGSDETTGPQNQTPSTPELRPADFTILPGDSVLMQVAADDADGDALTYAWVFSHGAPTAATGAAVVWTAPSVNGNVTVTVTASDGRGGRASAADTITVHPNAAYPYSAPFRGTLEPDVNHLSENLMQRAVNAQTCHFWASGVVLWTNSVVFAFTGLPTLAFAAALTHTPVWIPPSTWLWAYTVPWGQTLATVELYATREGATQLDWRMLISGTQQQYDRFPWVTGTCQTDALSGHWLLYDHRFPEDELEALRIEYARRADDDRDLDYSNVLESSAAYGDSLSYAIRGTDAEIRWHDVSAGTLTRVQWNTLDGSGTFTGTGGGSCCWGPAPDYLDVTCP